MKFTLSATGVAFTFTGYGEGWVEINAETHQNSLVLVPDAPPRPWPVRFEELEAQHFKVLLEYQPELVLFGSGRTFRFPHPRLVSAFGEARVGFEAMDTQAACRTFNVLAGEGRRVLAAILIDS
jgi:uncharacterized protein